MERTRCERCGELHWRFKKCVPTPALEVFTESRRVVPLWKNDTDKAWGDRTVTVQRATGWGDRSKRSPTFWNKEEPDGPQEAA